MKNWWRYITVFLLGLVISLALSSTAPAGSNTSSTPIAVVQTAQRHYQNGEYQKALQLLEQASISFAEAGQTLQQAQTQALISLAQQQLGSWQPAKQAIDYGMALLATTANTSEKQQVIAQLNNALGHFYQRQGQNLKAIRAWETAENNYQAISDRQGKVNVTIAKIQALEAMGFYRRACTQGLTLFDPTLDNCETLNPESVTALFSQTRSSNRLQIADIEASSSLANSLLLLGKLPEAEIAIDRAEDWQTQRYDPDSALTSKIALTKGNIAQAVANLARDRGNEELFKNRQRLAREQYQLVADSANPESLLANINLLELYTATQQWQPALKIARQSDRFLAAIPNNHQGLQSKLALTRNLVKLKQNQQPIAKSWGNIAQLYEEIFQEASSFDNYRLQSLALGELGTLAYAQNLTTIDARAKLEQALQLAQSKQAPEIAYRWQWQLGKVYRDRADLDRAILAYQAAVTNLQQLRSDLVALDREIQFSFREQVEPVYREFTELLLVAQAPTQVEGANNLRQARDAIEALQIAELDNYFKDACVTAQERSIEEIDPHAAVIYTMLLPDQNSQIHLEVILSLADGSLQHHETVLPQAKFQETVNLLGNYLMQPDRKIASQALAQEVYGWLIAPLEPALKTATPEVKTLVFVLDGVLQSLPMSALYNGDRYLLEDYAIAITPGLRTLKTKSKSEQFLALAGGISESIASFSSLKGVTTELDSIDTNLKTQTLVNSELTKSNLDRLINSQPFSIVHLATHGQFSSNPQETFLQLWDRRLTIEEFSLLLQQRTLNSERPIDLLVLSACETARGDRRAALGLAGMSVRTGIGATMATLWQVNDRSTTALMSRFYHYLSQQPELTKAEALRQAQLDLCQVSGRNWQTPLYWSAYVIVGNWT